MFTCYCASILVIPNRVIILIIYFFTHFYSPSFSEVNSDLVDIVKTVSSSTINLGALSSGSAGYGSTTVTIPSGYKTVGIANASKNHPGVGTAFNVMAFLQSDVTGQATVDYTYSAVGSVAANAADFHIRVLCVRS